MSTLDLTTFIPKAIRTESRIDTVLVNRDFLEMSLFVFLCAGNVLDQIKKNVFYGKPFDKEKLDEHFKRMLASINYLADSSEDFPSLNPNTKYGEDVDLNREVINVDTRIMHSVLGFATESTELVEQLFETVMSGQDFDRVHLREELGDMFWYSAVMMDTLKLYPPSVLQMVVDKLAARYPDKFTSEAAINRDLVKERQILEKTHDSRN